MRHWKQVLKHIQWPLPTVLLAQRFRRYNISKFENWPKNILLASFFWPKYHENGSNLSFLLTKVVPYTFFGSTLSYRYSLSIWPNIAEWYDTGQITDSIRGKSRQYIWQIWAIFWFFQQKNQKNWNIFGWLFNLKMLYLLNHWANSVQPVGADCWNTGFFIPGNLIICSWVIRRLFACNCWMGIILQPILANCGQFFLDFHVFYVNRALCWGLIWHRASNKLYQGQMLK